MNVVNDIISALIQTFFKFALNILDLLPDSPFQGMFDTIGKFDFLGYINWFIPFDFCQTVLSAWLLCVGSYYIFVYAEEIAKLIGAIK